MFTWGGRPKKTGGVHAMMEQKGVDLPGFDPGTSCIFRPLGSQLFMQNRHSTN